MIQQLIASGTHVVAKTLTENVAPAVVLFYRALIVSTLYLIYLFAFKKKRRRIEKNDYWKFLVIGLLNIPINQFLFLNSLELTSAPHVAFAYALVPAFVLVISSFWLKEKPTNLKILGIFLAFAGTVLLLLDKGFNVNSGSTIGDLLALTASLSWALYTIIGKQLSEKYGAIFTTGMAMFVGLLFYIPIFHFHPVEYNFNDISTINWLQIFYIAAITAGVGYALWYYALTKIEASKVSVFNNVQPVLTTILSVIFLGHVFTGEFVVGGGLIILGVVLTQRG